MKNPYRALEAIHRLVGGKFGMDLEWWLSDERIKKKDKRLVIAAEIITKIYLIAHSEVSRCNHKDWEDVKYKILKQSEED